MGCDIHTFIERKNKETDTWEHACLYKVSDDGEFEPADVYIRRNYELFGVLAGVRSSRDPFVPQRGVPSDLSDYVRDYYYDGIGDWHSGTWYDWCELKAYIDGVPSQSIEDIEGHWLYYGVLELWSYIDITLDYLHIWYPKPGDVRIVMWFDN